MNRQRHAARNPGRALLQWQRAQRVERGRQLEMLRLAGLPTDNQHHSPRRAP